jgi:hypothetical protein
MTAANPAGCALISPCERYRWTLDREVDPSGKTTLLWIMLNPSTADAWKDDPTIRKCRGFTQRLGFHRMRVVNLYGWRATKPHNLRLAGDPVGTLNDSHVGFEMNTADMVIVAWGGHTLPRSVTPTKAERIRSIVGMAGRSQALWCLGTTKDGSPRHPLMLPYETKLERWITR